MQIVIIRWIRSRWPIATLGATDDLAWRERFFDYQMPKNVPQATDCDYLHS